MSFIEKAWRGEESLRIVFWRYWFVFSLAFFGAFGLIVGLLDKFGSLELAAAVSFLLVPFVLMPVYGVWIVVSVWRCARNAKPEWKILARVWAVMALLAHLGPIALFVIEPWISRMLFPH